MTKVDDALYEKVKDIEFHAKSQVLDTFSGMYTSCFRGQGIEMEDIREYANGDDVRSVAWNKTAQMGRPFVKTFQEERDLIVILAVDISRSLSFQGHFDSNRERLTKIAALIAFTAMYNRDRVGLILFSDHVEKMIVPKRGMTHGAEIIRELLGFSATGKKTNIQAALDTINKVVPKRAITFLLSDFLDDGFEKPLQHTAKKDDLIAIRIHDRMQDLLPKKGLYQFHDLESDVHYLVDCSKSLSEEFEQEQKRKRENLEDLFKRVSATLLEVDTEEDFLEKIMLFFSMRRKFIR